MIPFRLGGALVLSMLLTGCGQMYWTRSDSATLERFTADHRDCLMTTGTPIQNRPGYVVITEDNFRVCMTARNWTREQWTSWEVPRGRFRSLEDFTPMPIRVDELPEQSSRAKEDVYDPLYRVPLERCIQCPVQ